MNNYLQNPVLQEDILAVEVVFYHSWLFKHTEIYYT